jgi:hypothetical protein
MDAQAPKTDLLQLLIQDIPLNLFGPLTGLPQ